MKSNLLPIASAGFKYIAFAALAFIVLTVFDLDFLAFISFVILLLLAFVYRNPEREILSFEANNLLSPVDGSVISIQEIQGEKYAYKVEIKSNYFDVAILRAPFDATLETLTLKRGARLAENSLLQKEINENVELTFVDTHANSIKLKHQLSRSFDSLHIDINASQNIRQSSRYGLMITGITTLYLPQNFRVNVALGNKLKASQSLIGYFC